MFDAFSLVDGGGAGRDGDDRKLEAAEWKAGWAKIKDHGFVALKTMTDEAKALEVFESMDDNAGGVVTLVEFCEFLKAAEVAAGTELGKLLDEDEEGGVGKKWEAPKGEEAKVKGNVTETVAGKEIKAKGAAAKKMGGMLLKANKAGVLEKLADDMEAGEKKAKRGKEEKKAAVSETADTEGPALGDFTSVFEKFGRKTDEAAKLRQVRRLGLCVMTQPLPRQVPPMPHAGDELKTWSICIYPFNAPLPDCAGPPCCAAASSACQLRCTRLSSGLRTPTATACAPWPSSKRGFL